MDNFKAALKGQYHAALDMLKGAIDDCPDAFIPWEYHRDEVESDQKRERLDAIPYSKAEMLTYWELVDAMVDPQLDKIDLSASESGIPWYKIPKLDHILLNLRHIQEHAGQLRDRLLEAGIDQKWVTKR
jgi:hypothetical protein